MGPNIAMFDLDRYGVNGKTVTCLPLGSKFDNFYNLIQILQLLSQDSLMNYRKGLAKKSICHHVHARKW